jgi:hypothetical protein
MRGIINKETYKGLTIKQVKGIFDVFEEFFNKRYFDNIYEIGSGNGGFSMWLAKKANEMNATFTTVDIKPIEKEVQSEIEFYGGVFKNVEHKQGNVDEVLIKGRHNLLLIDGAEKVPPFKYFAKFIRPGDFMLTHDFYSNEEDYEYGTFTLKDVATSIIENKLIIKFNELFDGTLWLCVTKGDF